MRDDGSLETGYGWVPSAVEGRYVQEFEPAEFSDRGLVDLCVCWTRTRDDDSVDFSVQLYRHDAEGSPLLLPEISVPASATEVPLFPGGAFYRVAVPGTPLPPGRVSIGVQWDPSQDQLFFVCADQSPGTPFTNGWFIDDRAEAWAEIEDANDPIFADHRALLIRPVAGPAIFPTDVPLSGWTAAALVAILGAAAVWRLR